MFCKFGADTNVANKMDIIIGFVLDLASGFPIQIGFGLDRIQWYPTQAHP